MRLNRTRIYGLAMLAALLGASCGYVAEAHAVDRVPFPANRPVGDGRPGYGAERQYYGAENVYRPYRGGLVRGGGDHRNYRAYGSFVEFGEGAYSQAYAPLGSFARPSRSGVYPSFGSSSVVYLNVPGGEEAAPRRDADDRPSDGVSVSYVGTAKIIHIANDANSAKPARAVRGAALEPWSESWERYCTRTHPDFDPARGTFTDGNGRSRFCTGE